jgi:uncharacterized protein with ParB-like and HNH nuclease domain
MKEPRKSSIGELLSGGVEYVIPRYQRAYDWKSDSQVGEFITDLVAAADSKDNEYLYLGPMIFDSSEGKKKTITSVIDGQQRLTTTLILLMALRDFIRRDLGNEAVAQSIQTLISNSDPLSSDVSHRLTPSPVISRIFPLMSDYAWDGKFPSKVVEKGKSIGIKREVNRVRPIYNFCREQIRDYVGIDLDKARSFAKQIRDNTFVIRIEIEDSSEAFEIFERTNARGKELEVTDLLKNYLFSKEKEYLEDDLDERWDTIVADFGASPIKALKQFWISRKGKVNSRQLYRNIRSYADTHGVNDFLYELVWFSGFYRVYNQPDYEAVAALLNDHNFPSEKMLFKEFHRSISVLKSFNITQPIPLIFSVLRSFYNSGGDKAAAKKILSLVRAIEFFHIANNKVGGRIGNETENKYAEFSEKIFADEDLSALPAIRTWFENAMLSEEEFLASFVALSYENKSERNTIRYVFDRLVNDGVKDGQTLDLLDVISAQSGVRPSYDIEHLTPQSHAEDEDDQSIYDGIGNLIVIPKQINGILGDKTFSEKIKVLKNPHQYDNNIKNVPSYLQAFVDEVEGSEWDKAAIRERARSLGGQVFEVLSSKSSYK